MPIDTGLYVTQNVKLVRPLGRGGMGSVWVAHHEGLDADVAVKFVATDYLKIGTRGEDDPSVIERFKREAALSAKIKSPHVVKTFDHGVMDDGQPYIVMELLGGETLGDRLARASRLSAREVALVVSQTAQVLDEAHGLGVVHRDIKPDNLFLIASGYELFVKVLDFGIAKQTTKLGVASVTDTGAIVGTPEYMSPEQLLSPRSADWRSDMWALAVLAYRALTGTVPFKGETLPSLSLSICKGQHQPPSQLVAGLPPAIDAWFERALHPEPKKRFASVTAMSEAFLEVTRTVPGGDGLDVKSDPVVRGVPAEPGPKTDVAPRSETSGTLASVMSEAHPRVPRPEIAVEVAADDANAHVDALASTASPTTRAGRTSRRGPVVVEIDRPRSTPRPFSTERGFPLTTAAESAIDRRHGRLKLAGVLIAAVMVAAAADLFLRGAGETPRPSLAAGTGSALIDDLWETNAPERSTNAHVSSPVPSAPQSVSSAEASAAPDASSEPRTPTSGGIAVRPVPVRPKASTSASPICANPYILLPDGTWDLKPECL